MDKNSKTEEKLKQHFYFKLLKSVNEILLQHQWPFNKLRLSSLVSFWTCSELERLATQFTTSQSAWSSSMWRHAIAETDPQFYAHTYWLLRSLWHTVSIPVTVASCERPFSTLRRLKTWVTERNSMGEVRLTSLAIMNIHWSRHSPRCQWHYWSLRLREAKNSICFVHVPVVIKVTSVFYFL